MGDILCDSWQERNINKYFVESLSPGLHHATCDMCVRVSVKASEQVLCYDRVHIICSGCARASLVSRGPEPLFNDPKFGLKFSVFSMLCLSLGGWLQNQSKLLSR